MLKKTILTGILISGCIATCIAQSDTLNQKKEKRINHSIGVQVNDLVKQVLNFNNNNTTSTNTNPYQLTYSINSANKGWGARVGIGYNSRSSSNNDGITATRTTINDVHARLGIERAYKISKKWSTGIGIDAVYNDDNDHTTSMVNIITNTFNGSTVGTTTTLQTTDTRTKVSSKGGGPQGWLRYAISPRVLIGTEASFYYVTGSQSNLIKIDGISNTPKVSNYLKVATFSLPVVLFVNVRF